MMSIKRDSGGSCTTWRPRGSFLRSVDRDRTEREPVVDDDGVLSIGSILAQHGFSILLECPRRFAEILTRKRVAVGQTRAKT